METVLVLGATSGIARPLCGILAARGCRLILAGRDVPALDEMAATLRSTASREPLVEPFDALDFAGHAEFFSRCLRHVGEDSLGVVLCYGFLPDQRATEVDFDEARRTIDVNFTSAVSVLNLAANELERRRAGYVCVITSVAGDRGKRSNYLYGAAKAGLSCFLEGLRNRLHPVGVPVLTVKPGYVDTKMTRGRVDPKSWLVASPERVARDIDRAIRRRRNVIYTPWFWRWILGAARMLPECVLKRLRF